MNTFVFHAGIRLLIIQLGNYLLTEFMTYKSNWTVVHSFNYLQCKENKFISKLKHENAIKDNRKTTEIHWYASQSDWSVYG